MLTWQTQSIATVVAAVKRVARQPFVKLLTILDELMAAIFSVFLECNDPSLIEQTYATLMGVLGEANKNTNMQYKPRVLQWIESHFAVSKVWRVLAVQLFFNESRDGAEAAQGGDGSAVVCAAQLSQSARLCAHTDLV